MNTCPTCGGTFYDPKAFACHREGCNPEKKVRVANERQLNETAIREHALKCSKACRAGKFTRVGQDFIDEVQTDVETLVRNIAFKDQTQDAALPVEGKFTTGALLDKIEDNLNGLIGRIIQNKVRRQPSVGCTLGRTR